MAKRRAATSGQSELTEEMQQIVKMAAEEILSRRQPRSNWGLWMQAITATIAIMAIVFSAGINQSRLTALETRTQQLEDKQLKAETTADQRIAQVSVQLGQLVTTLGVTVQKVDDLRSTVSEIKGQLANNPRASVR